jgi:hypothetical protein
MMFISAIFFVLNKIIEIIGFMVGILYSVLPPSPFTIIENSEFSSLISQINYFLPVYEFVVILETWLLAIAVFYVYSIFARWLKAVQ